MKTSIKLVMALCVMGLVMTSCAKKVVLNVDTDRLLKDKVRRDFDGYASFKGQDSTMILEDHIIYVKKGRVIKWKGKASNKNHKVSIEMIKIKPESPVNPFPDEQTEIPYLKKWKGRMKKVVKARPIMVTVGGPNCKYSLYFSIEEDGKKLTDILEIDPEIEVQPER